MRDWSTGVTFGGASGTCGPGVSTAGKTLHNVVMHLEPELFFSLDLCPLFYYSSYKISNSILTTIELLVAPHVETVKVDGQGRREVSVNGEQLLSPFFATESPGAPVASALCVVFSFRRWPWIERI